jgi:hypothetical protein
MPDTVWQIDMNGIDRFDIDSKNACYSTLKALDKSTMVYDNIGRKEAV